MIQKILDDGQDKKEEENFDGLQALKGDSSRNKQTSIEQRVNHTRPA